MLTSLLISAGLFLIFIVLLLFGIVKKRRKPVYISLLFLLFAGISGVYTGFLFVRTAYRVVKTGENPLKRTGMEIYTALFDKPETNCVRVINNQDQYIPRIDCCIWLEFYTCPTELERIIAKKQLKPTQYNSAPNYSPRPEWFNLQSLGAEYKTLQKFNPDDPNHDLILYFSKDSTHAFYCDMAE